MTQRRLFALRSAPQDELSQCVPDEIERAASHIREGRFQRSLSLFSALSAVMSGVEVGYEHTRAGFGQRVMFTPLILSSAMAVAGVCGAFSRRAARTWLRWTSVATLADCAIGFGFHIRGIHRKPGGWRLPVTNIVMGPPLFAPLLLGISPYLGLLASFLRREDDPIDAPPDADPANTALAAGLREGRFQRHLATATMAATFCSGAEALYSHYKNDFRYAAQWAPIVVTPLLIGSAGAALVSARAARTWLPAMSALAVAAGGAGFFYHARGITRRSGGLSKPVYNVLYGPPPFAPLLFAACGVLGLLASLMRRER